MTRHHLSHLVHARPVPEIDLVSVSTASSLAGERPYTMRRLLDRAGLSGPEADRRSDLIRSVRVRGQMQISIADVIALTSRRSAWRRP